MLWGSIIIEENPVMNTMPAVLLVCLTYAHVFSLFIMQGVNDLSCWGSCKKILPDADFRGRTGGNPALKLVGNFLPKQIPTSGDKFFLGLQMEGKGLKTLPLLLQY